MSICKKLCGNEDCEICFKKSFASHEKSRWWSDKNNVNPIKVRINSGVKRYFICNFCDHEFFMSPDMISGRESWCPYCSSPPKKLCDKEDCKTCFEKSFASHEKSRWWSDKNAKKPRDIFKQTNLKYEFNCDVCKHSFDMSPGHITNKKNIRWCPYCALKILCDDKLCNWCYEKSFASHPRSKWWSKRNTQTAREIFKHSGKKYEFYCEVCSHYFKTYVAQISSEKYPRGCPYCCIPLRKLCGQETCDVCFKKSFASHEKSKYILSPEIHDPKEIPLGRAKKYEFKCDSCNSLFSMNINGITREKTHRWCPKCRYKTEKKLLNLLLEIHTDVVYQYKAQWCKSPETNKFYPFDFYIPSLNIIIELDGDQHFKQVHNWTSPEITQQRDIYKTNCCVINKTTIIRIPCENVYIKNYIDRLFSSLLYYEKARVIFICDDERYNYLDNYKF